MFFTLVYASNLFIDRELLWLELSQLASVIDRAWLLVGDSNHVLNPKDKKGGLPLPFLISKGSAIFFVHVDLQRWIYGVFNSHGEEGRLLQT